MKRRGFTLIELLVVIAIIAILAAILFPVFARAREKARQSSCQSNEKQIMLAVIMYSQDYDEKFPSTFRVDPDGNRRWCESVSPYVKNSQLFVCPSDSAVGNPFATCPGALNTSYMANWQIGWDSATSPISQGSVVAPSNTIYLCDGGAYGTAAGINIPVQPIEGCWIIRTDWWDANWGGPNPRHSEVANVGFVDGHVKAMKSTWYYNGTPWLNPAIGGS